MSIRPQDAAGGALRAVHQRFLVAWRRQRGAAVGEVEAADVAYVDAFAGGGVHRPPAAASERLPVVEAVAALPREAGVLLLEEDPARAGWIRDGLRDLGMGERLADGGTSSALRPGEIRLLECDLESAPLGVSAHASHRLCFLAPPSPDRLPLDPVLSLLEGEGTELLVRFPAEGLRLLARHPGSTLADLPPAAKRVAAGYSRLFGDPRQEWAFRWRAALDEGGEAAAERRMVEHYTELLTGTAGGGVVKRTELHAPGMDVPVHLLLITRDPGLPLLLNEVLYGARRDGSIRWADADEWPVLYAPAAPDLFQAEGGPGEGPRERVVDHLALAHHLAVRYAGRTIPLARVLADHADTDLFAGDLRRALSALRREGRALYGSLGALDGSIAFPRAAPGRTPRRGTGSSRRRGPDEPTLPFHSDDE